MKTEHLTILLAAIAAPGFWEVVKTIITNIHDRLTGKTRVSMAEVGEKLDIQGKKIDTLEKAFTAKNNADAENEAKAARRRILRADDEIRMGIKHSKDFFEDVIRDIDAYESFCEQNSHFKNHCAESAIRSVIACYDEAKLKNNFL